MRDYAFTRSRILQWMGILLALGIMAVGYWYWQADAGYKTNTVSPAGSLTSGLVGYWPFDRVSVLGTTAVDRSTNKYSGTLTGGPTVTSGKIDQALDLDGSDDYMALSSNSYLNVGDTADITLSGWFYRDTATTTDVIVSKINSLTPGETGYVVYIDASSDQLIFRVGDGVDSYTVNTSMTFVTPDWTHFVVVWDQDSAANTKIYINGQSVSTSTSGTIGSINDTSHTLPFRVGVTKSGGEYFDGKIDDIRVHNRTLTANEVLTLYEFRNTSKIGVSDISGNLNSGLAGYWKFDNGSGTSATDSSINGNTGTLTNGPTWTTGQVGGAVDFDGTNDYMDLGSPASLDIRGSITMSTWVKTDVLNTSQSILFAGDRVCCGTENYLEINWNAGGGTYRFIFGSFGITSVSSPTNVSAGVWYHVVGTWDGATRKMYINGVLVDSIAQTSPPGDYLNAVTIGSRAGGVGPYLNGSLDETRIYSRALSAEEVTQLYSYTGPAATDSGLVGYWSFNGTDTTSTKAYDRSGSGNTGTLTNGPVATQGKLGQAMSFDGVDDYVTIPDSTSLSPTSAMTVSFWTKITGTFASERPLIVKDGSGQRAWRILSTTGAGIKLCVSLDANDACARYGVSANSVLSQNQWSHVTVVFNGAGSDNAARAKIYLNGAELPMTFTGTIPASLVDTGLALTLGAYSTDRLPGLLDEVRVYNTALTTAQIQSLYKQGQSDEVNTGASQAQGTGRLDSGLTGYWKMDDGSGTSATDSSTNGNTGTLTNGPTWTTGQVGGAVTFDGTDDYVTVADTDALDVTDSTHFTLSGWFNRDTFTADHTIIAKRNGQAAGDTGYVLYVDDANDDIVFEVSDGTDEYSRTSTSSFPSTGWQHVVAVFNDMLGMTIYINGSVNQDAASGTLGNIGSLANAVAFRIGAESDAGSPFNGNIDEVRMYNRALSADEVSQLYRLTTPTGTDTSLKGYWSFNGQDISGTTAYDRSGAGNTGTLTNGPTVTPGKLGQALNFDGSNDYVDTGTRVGPSSAYSNCLWVKPSSVPGTKVLLGAYSDSGGVRKAYTQFFIGGSGFQGRLFDTYSGGFRYIGRSVASGLVANQWSFLCMTWDGGTTNASIKLYRDGVQVDTTNNSNGTFTAASTDLVHFWIGTQEDESSPNNPMSGQLDEVRIYNRALSAAEIQSLYNSSR